MLQLLELARTYQDDRDRLVRRRHALQAAQPSGRRHPHGPEHGVDEGPSVVEVALARSTPIRPRPATG
jgi:hypothetical protein